MSRTSPPAPAAGVAFDNDLERGERSAGRNGDGAALENGSPLRQPPLPSSSMASASGEWGASAAAASGKDRRSGSADGEEARSIVYVAVARGTTRLVSYLDRAAASDETVPNASYEAIAERILVKVPANDVKSFYENESLSFNFEVFGGITYLCICKRAFPRRLIFAFLKEVRERFEARFSESDVRTAGEQQMGPPFKSALKEITKGYTSRKDKVEQVQDQVREVSVMMRKNIEDTLDRGERLDTLVDKADDLRENAGVFSRQSTSLSRHYCKKQAAAVACIVVIVAAIVVAIVLGVVLSNRDGGGGGGGGNDNGSAANSGGGGGGAGNNITAPSTTS